jgi:hypothetical protein
MVYFLIPISFLAIVPTLNETNNLFRSLIIPLLILIILVKTKLKYTGLKIYYFLGFFHLSWYIIGWYLVKNQSGADFLLGAYGRSFGFITLATMYLAFILSATNSINKINSLFTSFKILTILTLFYGVIQVLHLDPLKWSVPVGTILLTVGNINFSSVLLAIVSIFLLSQLIHSVGNKIYYIFGYLIAVILTIQTNSYQGISIATLCAILLLIQNNKNKKLIIKVMVILQLTLILPLTLYLAKDTKRRDWIASILENQLQVSARINHWNTGVNIWLDNFWVGVGIDNMMSYSASYISEEGIKNLGGFTIIDRSHNVIIDQFAQGGLFSGLIWIWFCSSIFYTIIRIRKSKNSRVPLWKVNFLELVWLAYFLQSLISTDQILLQLIGMIAAGTLAGIWREIKVDGLNNDKF